MEKQRERIPFTVGDDDIARNALFTKYARKFGYKDGKELMAIIEHENGQNFLVGFGEPILEGEKFFPGYVEN